MSNLINDIAMRRTFAIISHPDAGKTTITEKILLFCGAISLAGSIKSRKASRHAVSDFMAMEKERGISISSSVMQVNYQGKVINLLDTPGHADFSEDTYRTLSAVDSSLMVIDGAKGVEERTEKLVNICRMRHTPVITFINKFDRNCLSILELIDDIEQKLEIECLPMTLPIGHGKEFLGVYDIYQDKITRYSNDKHRVNIAGHIDKLSSPAAKDFIGADEYEDFCDIVELLRTNITAEVTEKFRSGKLTPVFCGSAINNFGISHILDALCEWCPPPQPMPTEQDPINPQSQELTGFVFKIQANMDPKHRDRIAFFRICSGAYIPGSKLKQARTNKTLLINNAKCFMAGQRNKSEYAVAGDIIGIPNHGNIHIGETLYQGSEVKFIGLPCFAPELFREVILRDPLRRKALLKGLSELCEEGATQVFHYLVGNKIILGAVGLLQFDVVKDRLANEYKVTCDFGPSNVVTIRWLDPDTPAANVDKFTGQEMLQLSRDHAGHLVYLARNNVQIMMLEERWPTLSFYKTREL